MLPAVPGKLFDLHGQHMPAIGADELKLISQPMDFLDRISTTALA